MHDIAGHLRGVHISDVREPIVLAVDQALLFRFAEAQHFLVEHLHLLLACSISHGVLSLFKFRRSAIEAQGHNMKTWAVLQGLTISS